LLVVVDARAAYRGPRGASVSSLRRRGRHCSRMMAIAACTLVHAHFLAAPRSHEHIAAGALRVHASIARSMTKARTSAVIVQIWRTTLARIAAPVRLPTLGFAALVARNRQPGFVALGQSFVRRGQTGA
jgi:hypothetical protein